MRMRPILLLLALLLPIAACGDDDTDAGGEEEAALAAPVDGAYFGEIDVEYSFSTGESSDGDARPLAVDVAGDEATVQFSISSNVDTVPIVDNRFTVTFPYEFRSDQRDTVCLGETTVTGTIDGDSISGEVDGTADCTDVDGEYEQYSTAEYTIGPEA